VKLRETALDHLDGHGPAIDLQYDRIEHLLRIYLTLSVRNLTIAVRINPPKYLGRHSGTGREVNLQIHTLCVDRESRSLKIFIDPMRGGGSCQPRAYHRECREESAPVHGLTSFAP
jgi:hypothetical protein